MEITSVAITDVGKKRKLNEDYYVCDKERNIFLVADGMGGKEAGELASKMAAESFLSRISPYIDDEDSTFPFELEVNGEYMGALIKHGMNEANLAVYQYSLSDISLKGMGTTCTVVVPYKEKIYVGHIGDTRLYRMRDGLIDKLSDDHTLVQQLIKEGTIRPEEARNHKKKNVITRSLGPKEKIKPDIFSEPLMKDDIYLICSDGLYQMIGEDELFGELLSFGEKELEMIGRNLVFMANEKGGKDNITVVLFKIEQIDE